MRYFKKQPSDADRVDLPIDPDLVTDEPQSVQVDPAAHRKAQRKILAVIATGGFFGALARYGVGLLVPEQAGHFPWSTFLINVSGSFAIGFVLIVLARPFPERHFVRPLVATGFLGAYTTFSTYVVDTDLLFRSHDFATGIVYALASVGVGFAAAFCGIVAARAFGSRFIMDATGASEGA